MTHPKDAPDNRPDKRARIKAELKRSMKRAGCVLQEAAVEAVIDTVVLELRAQREVIAHMLEVSKEQFGSLDGEQLEKMAFVVLAHFVDDNGEVHLPEGVN